MSDTPQMTEAIRTGCNAQSERWPCSWPKCCCRSTPAAIRAAVTYVLTTEQPKEVTNER